MAVFAVTTATGEHWDAARDIREQDGWNAHAAWADDLVERQVIVLGGPISGGAPEEVALLMVQAADEAEVREIFRGDPWATASVLRIKSIRPWTLWLGSRMLGQ